jgi:hypothetical protein
VDFNTESGGSGGSGGSSQGSGGPPPRMTGGASGGEFDYSDPVQSFINAVRNVVTAPVGFFRGIRREGDFINPLIFAIISYEVSAILSGIVALAFGSRGVGGFLVAIIAAPIGVVIGLFIGAGILHLLVMLLVGSRNAGFEGTFRVSAYSSVTSLVSWIPFIGWIASLYGIYIAIMGIREVHSTTTGRAALVVLIPVIVIAILLVLILGAALLAIFAASQQ